MDEALGPIVYEPERPAPLSVEGLMARGRPYAEATAREIDLATRKLVDTALARETLTDTELRALLDDDASALAQAVPRLRTLNAGAPGALTMSARGALPREVAAMNEALSAGEICNRIVVVAERSTPVLAAAQRMREQHVGCLVVVEEAALGRRVVGVLTDRDIVTAVIAKAVDAGKLRVEDVMSAEAVTAAESTPFAELLATMRRQGLRRLPVVDGKGMLVGLITLDDLLEVLAEQMRTLVQAIGTEQQRERRTRR